MEARGASGRDGETLGTALARDRQGVWAYDPLILSRGGLCHARTLLAEERDGDDEQLLTNY